MNWIRMSSTNLPAGWEATTVEILCEIVGGGTPSTQKKEYWDGDIPWISSADIHGLKDIRPRKSINEQSISASATNLVPRGSIIVVTRVGLGKVALVPEPLCFSQDSHGLVFDDSETYSVYLAYYLSQAVQRFRHEGRGTTINGVTKGQLRDLLVLLPPLLEQHRIVAEVEKQFTRLDASVAVLKRARANLKRYRASVLKGACEGKLVPTEAELSQAEGRDYEPAAALLERIHAERRAHWESQEKRRGKYKEPGAPDTSDLPELPEGWVWAASASLTHNFDGLRVPVRAEDRASRQGQYPYYGASGIIDEVNDYLFDGTFLLIAEDGANLLARATPIAFMATGRFWVNNHAHVVKAVGELSLNYLGIYMNSVDLHRYVTGTAQPKLTQAALNRLPTPLPPLPEQQRIVAEVERRLSVIQQAEDTVEASLKRAERLRQSILKQAFSGQLVPQNPNDEPASLLLERIHAQREATRTVMANSRKSRRPRSRPSPARQLLLSEQTS